MKQKKKVWAKLKSGLFGWKVETKQHVQKTSATRTKHTSKAVNVKTVGNVLNLKMHTNFFKCQPFTAAMRVGVVKSRDIITMRVGCWLVTYSVEKESL